MVIRIVNCDLEDDDLVVTLTTNLFAHSLLSDYPMEVDKIVNTIHQVLAEIVLKEKDKHE